MSAVGNALNKAKKVGKKASKATKVILLKIKLIAIGVVLAIFLIIILTSLLYVVKEKLDAKLKEFFADLFPDNSVAAAEFAADGTIAEAAKSVHQILEENGYTYANDNSCATVEDSQAQGRRTCDCSTYVDWVLNRVGLDMQTRLCGDGMKQELESYSWITAVTVENAQAGDLVLFEGHIQIYAGKDSSGNDLWFNAGSTEAIQTPAPSGHGTPFSGGGEAGSVIGVYRVSATK